MDILFLLLACSIIIALVFLAGFIWSVRSGQYDDTYTPAMRMLFDEPPVNPPPQETQEAKTDQSKAQN